MLTLEGIEAGYGRLSILNGLSLTLRRGEVVAVLGPNGAGKSTLLRTISGLLPLRYGHISIDNIPIDNYPPHRVAKLGVAHVVEGRGIMPNLTVRENLLLGSFARSAGTPHGSDATWVDEVVTHFPWMKDRLTDLAGRLSGGQQQMVAIGRALVAQPRLMLLDEPSLGLAPLLIAELFETLAQIATEDRAVLLVEQHIHQSLAISDRAYVMRRGTFALSGHSEVLRRDQRVEEAYFS